VPRTLYGYLMGTSGLYQMGRAVMGWCIRDDDGQLSMGHGQSVHQRVWTLVYQQPR
jgi:hypothetical protein